MIRIKDIVRSSGLEAKAGLEFVLEYLDCSAAEFLAVVRPEALAPVSKAACLRRHQVEEGLAITGIRGRDADGEDLLGEKGACLLHRL